MNERTDPSNSNVKKAVMDVLRSRSKKARFMTEVYASLRRAEIATEEADRALDDLEAEGVVMVRDHFCADPHLAGVDLRVVALVESVGGTDPYLRAIREIDSAWDKWLGNYLANHRCG